MVKAKAEKKRKRRQRIANVLTIIDGLGRTPFKSSDKKGFDAEDWCLAHALYFKKKKIIKSARLSERFSWEDKMGRDLIIELLTEKIIYIQITATYHREDEIKAREQNVFYLPAYHLEESQITREKLWMIILNAYFPDHEPMTEVFKNMKKIAKKSSRLKRIWQVLSKRK